VLICFLELIEARVIGCFDLLDEESKLPTPRAEHFTTEVHNRNKGHPRLDVKEKIGSILKIIISNLASKKIKIACIT
jgi:myosin heavy subunit